ncbi:MAG: methylenetetrahydrofolate reductase [NAD(P)H] [Deltaproteobacteria bacterium]|nr:MAG: methylenetetrahydrofolate reductase [NAD(P)H] [Deltaproteobacteria bacterium]
MAERSLSFEFYPPKTDAGRRRFLRTLDALARLEPSYVSVTFGAGGSTREKTFETVELIRARTRLCAVPHISCITSTRDEIHRYLKRYVDAGIPKVVALRGDRPRDGSPLPPRGEGFRYAAELVTYIRRHFPSLRIAVACYPECHPESPTPHSDLRHFAEKVRAGADAAITQYFFNNAAYYRFRDEAAALGVDIPIYVGLMPIWDWAQVRRFSEFCGADVPRWIRRRMDAFEGDAESQRALGVEIAARQIEDLFAHGAPGIHFYTLNRAEPILRIYEALGLR